SSGVLSQGSGTGAAVGLSAMIAPTPQFTVALAYLSGTNIPLRGSTQIIGTNTQNIPQGNFHSQLSLPSILTLGIASRPVRGLTLEAGVQLTGWSSFDQIQYIYDNVSTATVPANFQNSFSIRFGVEYVMAGVFAVRGGIKYIASPVGDSSISPLYPDANAFQFGFGIGFNFSKNIRLDLAYAGNSFSDRNATLYGNYGTYSITQNQVAATFSYAFEPTSNPLHAPLK
ncbi:MAG TPA: outer membrane protein transport protein, partial [Candidatus Kapabacteria bacterium]|nr:outer membrane protein transport protein [Candidatus Kapabacteria bacterium]